MIMDEPRSIVWFSCGAASAVAAKCALEQLKNVVVVYCDTMQSEHADNERFFNDVQAWLGVKILKIKSTKYDSIDDVFEKTRYMAGINGARCTTEMKKIPRYSFQKDDDIHIFGFTVEEQKRIESIKKNHPELKFNWILSDKNITKQDCFTAIFNAGIRLPEMYHLGFSHNNCLGCVKATSPDYWLDIKKHFPEVFEHRAQQARKLNVKLVRVKGKRIFIDELVETMRTGKGETISCGLLCG